MPRAQGRGHLARDGVPGHGVLEHAHGAVEHRQIEIAAHPGPLPLPQGGADADRRVEAGQDIADRRADAGRLLGSVAREAHQAAAGLHDHVVGRLAGVGARAAESGGRGVHEPGIAGPEHVAAEAEPLHRAGPEVLHEHVGPIDERQKRLPIDRILQIEREALLAAIDAGEVAALAARQEGAVLPGVVAAVGPLDLHHLRAQVSQDHGAERAGQDPREVENSDAGKRLGGHRGVVSVGRPQGLAVLSLR